MKFEETKKWCFTSWGDEIKFKKFELCDFMICQLEECPTTERLHWQGYIEFKKIYTLRQVKSLFKEKGLTLATARESRERNILYCSKDKTYKGRRISYIDGEINNEDTDYLHQMYEFDQCFDNN